MYKVPSVTLTALFRCRGRRHYHRWRHGWSADFLLWRGCGLGCGPDRQCHRPCYHCAVVEDTPLGAALCRWSGFVMRVVCNQLAVSLCLCLCLSFCLSLSLSALFHCRGRRHYHRWRHAWSAILLWCGCGLGCGPDRQYHRHCYHCAVVEETPLGAALCRWSGFVMRVVCNKLAVSVCLCLCLSVCLSVSISL